jgi:PAS domain S-box-containing protein
MMAIVFLPRQFQMAVVENYDEGHIEKASWLFPLYLLLINIFVLPIAYGGLLQGWSGKDADYFVLTIPYGYGERYLALFAFIGGFSAATAMVIVESLALSTMAMNSIIMPALIKFHEVKGFPSLVLNIKRLVILGVVYLGYLFATSIGEFYGLVEIGLKSFELVALFAPAFFLGLYWKRGTKAGAAAGIIAGFIVWFYTLVVPDLIRAGIIPESGIIGRMVESDFFNPDALFGIEGFGKWGHSLFWGMLFNLISYSGISLFTRQSREEEIQSLIFVESYEKVKELTKSGSYTVDDIEYILSLYLGKAEARDAVDFILSKRHSRRDTITPRELFELRNEAEKVLAGAIGSSIAAVIFENKLFLTEKERDDLSESVKQITESLRLSRQELAEANRKLSYLKEFSENIIESAPVGITTIDSDFRIRYWNKKMESITSVRKDRAADRSIIDVLPWIKKALFTQSRQEEFVIDTPSEVFRVNISPLRDPSGGFVVIIEDITEQKRMEEQLLQASKLASLGKLTAGISHEIGNPLASISSLVQELMSINMDSKEDRVFTEEALKTINGHIGRIANIVRSLGDFARVSTTEKTVSNLVEILDRTINLVKYDKRFKNIQLVKEIEDNIPEFRVNQDKIQQVFLNLIINALDAMPDGGMLRVAMKRLDSQVEIIFNDSGVGIEPDVIDKIFDPFFTTKSPGRGTGLGLSICYGIIREHNGTITVKSKKGEGTTFTIRLPFS